MFIDVVEAPLDDFWPGVFAMGVGGDMRPATGTPGLVDWRTAGALSSIVKSGTLTAESGEQTLLWSDRRRSKIYLFGLGKRIPAQADIIRKAGSQIVSVLTKAGERNVALIPDPILTGAGGQGAEGPFLEGVLAMCKNLGATCKDFRLVIPAMGAESQQYHEGFRKAVLRLGHEAEAVSLNYINAKQFALQP